MKTQIIMLSAAILATLSEKVTAIEVQQNEGNLPAYDIFVERLFNKLDSDKSALAHAVMGITGEAGELTDAVKKHWAYNKELDQANVIEELGDLRFYYQAMLNMFGLTDEDVCAMNMDKLQKRYPTGVYRDQDAIARADKEPYTGVTTAAMMRGQEILDAQLEAQANANLAADSETTH